jgi:exosortase/archaeosortase family protein
LFSRWEWWQKLLAVVAAFPIAVAANATRIVVTGILMANFSSEVGRRFSHDFSGWIMIPLAAMMFWLFLAYLDRLFPVVMQIEPGMRHAAGKHYPG